MTEDQLADLLEGVDDENFRLNHWQRGQHLLVSDSETIDDAQVSQRWIKCDCNVERGAMR